MSTVLWLTGTLGLMGAAAVAGYRLGRARGAMEERYRVLRALLAVQEARRLRFDGVFGAVWDGVFGVRAPGSHAPTLH